MRTRAAMIPTLVLLGTASSFAADIVVVPYTGPGAEIPISVIRQNMMDDPNFMARVAQAEGMTPARFMCQGEQRRVSEQQASASAPMPLGRQDVHISSTRGKAIYL
jgi:hypothetical protein